MQNPDLEWKSNETPVATRFDDPYFSLDNGLEETRHVFLAGNDLPARLKPGFRVAELGFGTGLNFLALWAALPVGCTPVHFTSFEAFPMAANDLARALGPFQNALPQAGALLNTYDPARRSYDFGPITLDLVIGDARETLPSWSGVADAWFLDGFSPSKNPELWEPALMQQVGAHTARGGTFATYTAAGFVRRGLAAAGFKVEKRRGYGRKRDMSIGVLGGNSPICSPNVT